MTTRRLERKRSVVLNADVVGFSAMMAHDALGTIEALLDNTRALAHAVESFGGRVVDNPGDNLMAEFQSEAPAVRCAIYFQWREAARNRHLPAYLRIRFRIGIHAGEVYDRGGRLYGNAVNVAARLQGGADPGGVLVSQDVADRSDARELAWRQEYPPRRLKNIPEPVLTLSAVI